MLSYSASNSQAETNRRFERAVGAKLPAGTRVHATASSRRDMTARGMWIQIGNCHEKRWLETHDAPTSWLPEMREKEAILRLTPFALIAEALGDERARVIIQDAENRESLREITCTVMELSKTAAATMYSSTPAFEAPIPRYGGWLVSD